MTSVELDFAGALSAARAGDLARANEVLGGCGVEYVECAGREIAYVNMGDTYDRTVCAEDGKCWIGSWGDWYETAEQSHEEDEDVIRCGYCGEFTPLCAAAMAEPAGARSSWSDTRCEHCGRNVSSGEAMAEPSDDDDE